MKVYVLLVCWLCMVTWIPRCDGRKSFEKLKNFFEKKEKIDNSDIKRQDVSIHLNIDPTRKPEPKPDPRPPPRSPTIPAVRQPRPAPKLTQITDPRPPPRQTKRPAQRQALPVPIPAQSQEPIPAHKSERMPAATGNEIKVSTSKIRPRKPKRQPTRNNRPAAIRNQEAQNTAPKPRTAVSQQIKRQQPIVSSSSRQQARPKTNPTITSSIQDERKPLSIPPQKNSNTAQQSQPTKRTPQRSSSFINSPKPAAKDTRPKPKPRPQSRKCLQVHKEVFRSIKQRSEFDRLVLTPALNWFKDVEECRNPEFSRYLQELLDHRSATFGI